MVAAEVSGLQNLRSLTYRPKRDFEDIRSRKHDQRFYPLEEKKSKSIILADGAPLEELKRTEKSVQPNERNAYRSVEG